MIMKHYNSITPINGDTLLKSWLTPHVCLPFPPRFYARSAKMPQADEGPIEPPLQPKGPVVDQAGVDPEGELSTPRVTGW
jgi:hypothetical protein